MKSLSACVRYNDDTRKCEVMLVIVENLKLFVYSDVYRERLA